MPNASFCAGGVSIGMGMDWNQPGAMGDRDALSFAACFLHDIYY